MDILVVEDDPDSRDVLSTILRGAGYSVETAIHGRDALDKLRANRPDLIVLDLWMPVMNGWEFLLELRALTGGERIPVVILTADHRLPNQLPAARVFLKKPVDIGVLLGTVETVLPGQSPDPPDVSLRPG